MEKKFSFYLEIKYICMLFSLCSLYSLGEMCCYPDIGYLCLSFLWKETSCFTSSFTLCMVPLRGLRDPQRYLKPTNHQQQQQQLQSWAAHTEVKQKKQFPETHNTLIPATYPCPIEPSNVDSSHDLGKGAHCAETTEEVTDLPWRRCIRRTFHGQVWSWTKKKSLI